MSNNSGFVLEIWGFEACDDFMEARYIWVVCTILCFALGFPASIAILWEMFKTHRQGTPLTPNNFFILNLSAMDVVFLSFIPPGLLNYFIWQSSGFEACWNGIYSLNVCGRPLLMACTCLDCYVAVVHPITYRKRKSLTPRAVMAGIAWTLTIAVGLGYGLSHRLYISMFPTVPYILAIVIIAICDSFILHTLLKSDPGRKNIHPQKQRAIQTLINSLVMTVFSYLPPALVLSIGKPLIGNINVYVCTIVIPITITSAVGSAVMPILHLNNNGKLNCFKLECCKKS